MIEEQINETEGTESPLHPLLQQFVEPTRTYFETMNDFSDKWDDSTSDRFREDIVDYCRNTTYEFLCSLTSLTNGYEKILQQAEGLTKWNAGFGNFLSIIDIEMLAERQMSRWLFKSDDKRWLR